MARTRERPTTPAAAAITTTAIVGIVILLVLPLASVLTQGLADGIGSFVEATTDEATLDALGLTLFVVVVVVPFHAAFGLAAAWLLTRQDFRGKSIVSLLVDLPFTISPIVSGLLFVLLFGARGWLGPTLREHDLRVIYAVPGVVLATLFVTLPFVVRELVPTMEAMGRGEEEAAASLGASGTQILWRVTLPRVRWALFYGCVLCAARAAGEFGAVNVVSGNVRGSTTTLPLHVEILWGEYHGTAAFAVASLLACSGLVTLGLKAWLERRVAKARQRGRETAAAGGTA